MNAATLTHLYSPEALEKAQEAFLATFPNFANTAALDKLRATDYGRLDAQDQVYLDYTGGGLYAESQLHTHMEMLRENVFGNPHSHNPTSMAMTELVERARTHVLEYFNTTAADYAVIFTPNASGALKLVGEAYPFERGSCYLLAADDHNSVNGIREFARMHGAGVNYAPLTQPELRLDEARLDALLATADPNQSNLFAFPAQSNYSGVKHPLELIERAHRKGWDVLLDAAAFAPTNRLDLSRWRPDFVSLSFYKIFGYPTGVGALLVRRPMLRKLRRPWFAGGTVKIVSVQAMGHFLAEDEAAFEDGTVNYLMIPAVEIGLRHITAVGIDTIAERVRCLTGWLLQELKALRHSNGRPIIRIHGPNDLTMRGGTLTLSFFGAGGNPISGQLIEQLAGEARISLRTGCFCNPGSGETTFGLTEAMMRPFFSQGQGLHFGELVNAIYTEMGIDLSAVRISVGLATNFADVYRFMRFVASFVDQEVSGFEQPSLGELGAVRDTA